MHDWAIRARALLEADTPTAMLTILATAGSAPRDAGTHMLVTAGAQFGTIGGGMLEHRAIDQARRLLDRAPGSWRVQDYPLGPLLGQCCGGKVRLLVERLDPDDRGWLAEIAEAGGEGALATRFEEKSLLRSVVSADGTPHDIADPRPVPGSLLIEPLAPPVPYVILFGGGHVGAALAAILNMLPMRLDWIDTRPGTPAAVLSEEAALSVAAGAAPGAMLLVMTHDHGLDYRIVAAGLSGSAASIGLIGSETKAARFRARLARAGIDDARLTCPIGVPSIAGKEPAVIAVAIAAQLLARIEAREPVSC